MIAVDPLAMPVGALVRPVEALFAEDSLRRAAEAMRRHGVSCLPVVSGGRLMGMATQEGLARALAFGMGDRAPVGGIVSALPRVLISSATGAEALRMFRESGASTLVVVDQSGMALGVLTPVDLIATRVAEARPRMVGGMATPLGVYLTNGAVRAGAGGWALVATGALLFALFLIANMLVNGVDAQVQRLGLPQAWENFLLGGLALGLFLGGIRALPLAGTHAAEHMVVHALERGEDLVPEVVARMPRVHPRCGTNLAAGAVIFLGVQSLEWIGPDDQTRMLIAALAALFLWRPVGSALQYYVTTKPPTAKQIEDGIRVGRELIARFQTAPRTHATLWLRFANSGLPQLLFGSVALTLLLHALQVAFGWMEELRVYF